RSASPRPKIHDVSAELWLQLQPLVMPPVSPFPGRKPPSPSGIPPPSPKPPPPPPPSPVPPPPPPSVLPPPPPSPVPPPPPSMGLGTHAFCTHIWFIGHVPHEPPQPSSPHVFPLQLAVQRQFMPIAGRVLSQSAQ